jgi:hypothetical protein
VGPVVWGGDGEEVGGEGVVEEGGGFSGLILGSSVFADVLCV